MANSTAKKAAPKTAAKKTAAKPQAKVAADKAKAAKAATPKPGAVAQAVKGAAASLTDKTRKGAADLLGDADKAVALPPVKNDVLEKLLDSQRSAAERAASIRGVAANELKQAKEAGLHLDAFRQIMKLEKKSPEERNAFLAAFDSMRLERGYATQANLFGDVEPVEKEARAGSGKVAAAGK